MIQLDANYLVRGWIDSTEQARDIRRWLEGGESLGTSAIAWMEFATGPVNPEVLASVRFILEDRITVIGADEAELAAELFNHAGRKRPLRYDCLIAAAAIHSGSRLATANFSDFSFFIPYGLELASSR